MRDLLDLIGRIFLSAIFIFEAIDTILYMEKTKQTMALYGLNANQDMLLYLTIAGLVTGALMLLLGYRPALAAIILLIYWVPVTVLVHDFWNFPKDQFRIQSIIFMQHIAIAGGLIMYGAKGSGRYSIKKLFATTRV
jgi:putative oxidoreductase